MLSTFQRLDGPQIRAGKKNKVYAARQEVRRIFKQPKILKGDLS